MAELEKKETAAKADAKVETKAETRVDKPKKEKKAEKKDKKPGIIARVSKWLKDMKAELKKVQWPTRKQTINNTLIVIACVIVVGIVIGAFDFIAGRAIEAIMVLLG